MGHQHVLEPELRTRDGAKNFAHPCLTKPPNAGAVGIIIAANRYGRGAIGFHSVSEFLFNRFYH